MASLRTLLLLGVLATVAACRLGGPPAWSPATDAAADFGMDAAVGGKDGAGPALPPDGGGLTDAEPALPPDGGGLTDAGPTPLDAGADVGSGCLPPFAAEVCDPVCNTGCPPLSRCDVSEAPRRGACVGVFIVGEGGPCFSGSTTDSCAVRLTCLEGRCRRLCYRDADCSAGSCCSQPLAAAGAPSGFAVCAPCAFSSQLRPGPGEDSSGRKP
jgi:hypothetical protein